MKRAFTLIELLVVIGVMAVIAAGVIATINPQQKRLQAMDSQSQNAVGQVSSAMQAFIAQDALSRYPANIGGLVTSGELVVLPVLPAGANWVFAVDNAAVPPAAAVGVNMQATRNLTAGASSTFCWMSDLGSTTIVAQAACVP
jgi:prepilin-type N-terminal cleavage/methylation domain-containing protein